MDANRLTTKSQEALHDAQTKALRFGHVEVDGEHLLLALLDQPDGLAPRLAGQAGGDPDAVRAAVEAELGRRPRVSGPGAEPGQVFVTQRLSRLLDTADREAGRLKDEYVSVEHLLLALAEEGSVTAAGRALKDAGLTRDRLLSALTGIRGNQRVSSANPEVAYEALDKYGRDLVADARAGKLRQVAAVFFQRRVLGLRVLVRHALVPTNLRQYGEDLVTANAHLAQQLADGALVTVVRHGE